jgi:hypothetical protein
MPSTTPKMQRFMGAELGRKKAGLPTKTGMSLGQLKDFATVKPNAPNQPLGKPGLPAMKFKRRKPKELGLPNTGVGNFSMAVKPPGMGGRY